MQTNRLTFVTYQIVFIVNRAEFIWYDSLRLKRTKQLILSFQASSHYIISISRCSMTIFILFATSAWTWIITTNLDLFHNWLFLYFSPSSFGLTAWPFATSSRCRLLTNFSFHDVFCYIIFNRFNHCFKHRKSFLLIFT